MQQHCLDKKKAILNDESLDLFPPIENVLEIVNEYCNFHFPNNIQKKKDFLYEFMSADSNDNINNIPELWKMLSDSEIYDEEIFSLNEEIEVLLSKSKNDNPDVMISRLESIELHRELPSFHDKVVSRIIFYDNNKKFITCSWNNSINIRNSDFNQVICVLYGHKNCVSYILLLSDGRLASCGYDKTIRIWDIEHRDKPVLFGKEQVLHGHKQGVSALLEIENSVLLSCSWDATLFFLEFQG